MIFLSLVNLSSSPHVPWAVFSQKVPLKMPLRYFYAKGTAVNAIFLVLFGITVWTAVIMHVALGLGA